MIVLLGLSTLLTVFLGGCIGLRHWDRTVHPALKYASIVVLVAVIGAAGLQIVQLFDFIDHMSGLFVALVLIPVALVLIPLAVVGAYLQQRSHLAPVNRLSTLALSWGPSFIIGVIMSIGIPELIYTVELTRDMESLRLPAVVLGGITIIASGLRLSSWINPLVSADTPS